MMHARHDLSVARSHKLKHVSEADIWWTKMNVHGRSMAPRSNSKPPRKDQKINKLILMSMRDTMTGTKELFHPLVRVQSEVLMTPKG